MKIRFFSLLTALLVPLVASAASISVIIDGQLVIFRDVPGEAWYATYVEQSAEAGIVNGYKDTNGRLVGLYGPDDSVTIAQALKIAIIGAGYPVGPYPGPDCIAAICHWAYPYVTIANREGFNVEMSSLDRSATRAEVAQIFTDAFRVDTETPVGNRYDDVTANTSGAFSIEALSRDNVVTGDTNASGELIARFRPASFINRAETAKIVINARRTYGMPGSGVASEDPPSTMIVSYTDAGFSPAEIRVAPSTSIVFRNDSDAALVVASDPHPTHTMFPALNAPSELTFGDTSHRSWNIHVSQSLPG